MFKISIPKPCFEGWENMLPNEHGRFCNSCAKTVVDFSVMSDEAVQQYIISNYGQHMCGRFKTSQLQRIVIELPQNIFRIRLPFWKKFLAAFLICFGGSFLGIDTTVAKSSFIQGTPITYTTKKKTELNPDNKKPHSKKRKRKNRTIYIPGKDITIFLEHRMGYMPSYHEEAPPLVLTDSTKYKSLQVGIPSDTSTTVNNNTGSGKPGKTPASKIPDTNAAIILPAVLAARNPFSKKKKA